MKLSLCVIAGNVENYIARFIEAFQPLADEICIVRAIGDSEPDQTIQIASSMGCHTDEYFGDPLLAWDHVDDFAKARQKSFNMATHDLIMWADTDDIISPESIAAIKDAIARLPAECDGIEMPYVVPEDGLTVFRERIIRKGAAVWRSPIHEHLAFHKEPQLARITNAHILHMPSGPRTVNNERNLRILENIPPANRTGSHRFHLFQSLRAVGRIDDATREICEILKNPPEDIGKAEKYELFIAAGQLSQEPGQRSQMMLQALATDPGRREAYGELANCMVALSRPEDCLAYTSAMRAIPRPLDAEWNIRSKYYGYLGESLHGMALRINGHPEQADAIETNHFIRSGAKISLVHATRGRVPLAVKARQTWLNRAADPDSIEHIFGLDIDDESSVFLAIHNHVLLPGNGGPVAAWNAAAEKSKGQVIVQMSDDFDPPMHWDKLILEAIGDTTKPAVLAVSDGHRDDGLLCMAIVTRARYQQQGHLFHPEFFSMHSDDWFTECANRDGVIIDARDRITFEHLHPAFGKGVMDATYARSNDGYHYQTGQGIMARLRDGVRVSTDVDGWCDYKDLYSHIAKTMPDGAEIVEIGSWQGQSIIHLCQRFQDIGNTAVVHCVDTFLGEQNQPAHVEIVADHGGSIRHVFEDNTHAAGVSGMITIHQGDSAESAADFADGSLDFIFIDAAHDYDSVVKDLATWWPKLKPGGIFAGHDYPWHEVKKAVDEHAAENGYSVAHFGRCWIKTPTPQP
tara:strand:+ start:138 stop:2372 length:2235 start_codon:yes stop_codon:yes gene_type:complete